jgi:hypothetical protein
VVELHVELLARRGLQAATLAHFLENHGYRLDPNSGGLAWIWHD